MSPSIILFLFTMVVANIGRTMWQPLFPLYVQSLGATVEQVGIFFTLSAIAPLTFQIVGGWLSDQIGRLQAIAIGSVAGVAGYVVMEFAPSWEWLLLASLLNAVTFAMVAPSFDAFVAEQSDEKDRGRIYGLTTTIFVIVDVVGPPLGGFLAQGLSFKAMYLVAGSLYTVAAVIRIFMALHAMRTETAPRERPSFGALRTSLLEIGGLILAGGLIMWIFVADGIRDLTFNMSQQLWPIYMHDQVGMSMIQIAWLSSIAGLVTMIFTTPSGMLSDRFGERKTIAAGWIVTILAVLAQVFSPNFFFLAIGHSLFGLGVALIFPAYQSLISKAVPQRIRGTAFGLLSTGTGLISLPMPYFWALMYEQVSPRAPFFAIAGLMSLLVPIIWLKFNVPRIVESDLEPAAA